MHEKYGRKHYKNKWPLGDKEKRTITFISLQNQKQMIQQNASTVEGEIKNEKMINQLKAKVALLQDENSALKSSKFNSYSVPDLSNPSLYRTVST